MKKILVFIIMINMLTLVSHAGQWQQDDAGWRYQSNDGTYETGWYQDANGKWYYFDKQTTYMLTNTTTPDGHSVASDGTWQQEGEDKINNSSYDNVVNVAVFSYEDGPTRIGQFKEQLPVTVHYNDEYEYSYRAKKKLQVKVSNMEVSKDGVLYATLSAEEENYYHELKIITRYVFEDGTYGDTESSIGTWGGESTSGSLMTYYGSKNKATPISAEVYVMAEDVL